MDSSYPIHTKPGFKEVQAALFGQQSRPAMAERQLEQRLCEQLIWRRGAHLWRDEATALATQADGCRLSGFGAVTAMLSDDGFAALAALQASLPANMGIIAGFQNGPAAGGADAAMQNFLENIRRLSAQLAGAGAVRIRTALPEDKGFRREVKACLSDCCKAAKAQGLPVIWDDQAAAPAPLEEIAGLPFDAVWLSERYPFSTGEAIRRYGKRFGLLGRTDFARLLTLKPMDIIDDFRQLWELSAGKGYLFGSGGEGAPIPYLTFLSMLTALERLA